MARRARSTACVICAVIGFAEERPTIGADQLEAVAEELVTVTPE